MQANPVSRRLYCDGSGNLLLKPVSRPWLNISAQLFAIIDLLSESIFKSNFSKLSTTNILGTALNLPKRFFARSSFCNYDRFNYLI